MAVKRSKISSFLKKTAALVLLASAGVFAGYCLMYAHSSKITKTFKASVTFGTDLYMPSLTHTVLERISPVTKVGLVSGTVSDDHRIDSISVHYRKYGEELWSTGTVEAAGVLKDTTKSSISQDFSYTIPREFITGDLEYRIKIGDGVNTIWFHPNAAWQKVELKNQKKVKVSALDGAIIILPDGNAEDGETKLVIPAGALDIDTEITITELDPESAEIPAGMAPALTSRPLAVYRLEPDGTVFRKPVTLSLLYLDIDKDGAADGTQYGELTVKAMWWDGFEWRILGTTIDELLNTATVRTRHFSYYAVFPSAPLRDEDYRCKERIITPASEDKHNDYATFGPLAPDDTINIFNINGRRIRQLNGDDMYWDGKDDRGEIAPSGIYVYQIKLKAEGKIISGTIVIAK